MADNIYESILEQIKDIELGKLASVEVGYVEEVGDGIARVSGLDNVRYNELVQFENGIAGIAFNLEKDNVGVIIMGAYDDIQEGDTVSAWSALHPCRLEWVWSVAWSTRSASPSTAADRFNSTNITISNVLRPALWSGAASIARSRPESWPLIP